MSHDRQAANELMQSWHYLFRSRLLAQHFGISNVGLAKLCSRHRIPTPPCGYWALLKVGRAPPKPVLPAIAEERPISIRRAPPRELPPEAEDALRSAVTAEKTDVKRIGVVDRVRATHPVVRAAKEALQAAELDEIGCLRPKACHAIRVSRAQRSRALRPRPLENPNCGYILATRRVARSATAARAPQRKNPEPLEMIRGFEVCEEGESNPHGS